jgi:hypothetical protein
MKIVLLILSASFCLTCTAQSDDYPDYRSKKDLFTRIQEKDIRSDIASYSMAGIEESVGKLPLNTLPIKSAGNDFIIFGQENVEIKITGSAFDKTKHKLGYFDTEKKYLTKIDNKGFFGDYSKMPKTQIADVTIIIARDTIVLPKEAFFDLYNPIFSFKEGGIQKSSNKVYLSADGKKMYIYMLKQETGGSYEVTWVIQDKKYYKRVVDFGFLK